MTINGLLKEDKGFFKASLDGNKVIIDIIKSVYSIDFNRENSLANIFGFSNKILTYGRHISEIADDGIFICCNLIDDSYVNNEKMNSIYRFRLANDIAISIEPSQVKSFIIK